MCLLWSNPVLAQKSIQMDASQVRVNKSNPLRDDKKPEELELAKEILLKQKKVEGIFNSGDNYTSFAIELLSRIDTRIRIEWDDEYIDITSEPNTLYRLNRNKSRTFSFLAFQPTKGSLRLYNEADELVLTIPYEVKQAGRGKNSISLGANSKLGSPNPRLNVRYSHSRSNDDGGRWSFRVGASGSIDDISNVNVNTGVTYSW